MPCPPPYEDNTVMPERDRSDSGNGPAYLRIFDPQNGCSEYELARPVIVIGRDARAHIQLAAPEVSREHAKIHCTNGLYALEDCNSSAGTTVNGKKISRCQLHHKDTIQIADFVLQFRTDTRIDKEGEAKKEDTAAAKRAAYDKDRFCFLPTSMKVNFRFVKCAPGKVFAPGDTLPIGNGGIRIICRMMPPPNVCVEVELLWPDKKKLRTLAEIIDIEEKGEMHHLCLKLHRVEKDVYHNIVSRSKVTDWIDAIRPDGDDL